MSDQPGGHLSDEDADTSQVSRVLGRAPSPPMPADVAARLDAVLADEAVRRRAWEAREGLAGSPVTPPGRVSRSAKPALVSTPAGPPRWRRAAAVVLVAAVSAAAVAAGGYALSSAAGLNEPTAAAPLQVRSADLAEQARTIAETRDLSAHTFSGAWRCARAVTPGRITALAPAVVDGSPALLVYTSVRGEDWVTVVTGCPRPGALARESARLSP